MADNTELNSGSGGDTIRTDEIAGVKVPVSKVMLGADGTDDGMVSSATPMPVTGTLTAVTDITNTVTVDMGANNDVTVQGEDAENAAASANPVQIGGRYDATPRTLGDGDVGAVALDADGAVHVADGGNSITVDNSDLTTLAGAVSGSEMQVDVVAALPAGTNAIGKLAPNSGVDIGDVDVTSVVPGTGATNLGKAEDAVHSSGDTGIMSLAVRNDTLAALAGTDGDYAPLQVDASGAVYVANSDITTIAGAVSGSEMQVDVVAALPAGTNYVGKVRLTDGTDDATIRDVTGAVALDVAIVDGSGNQITSFGGSGGTSETDDAAFTAGSGFGTPAMGFSPQTLSIQVMLVFWRWTPRADCWYRLRPIMLASVAALSTRLTLHWAPHRLEHWLLRFVTTL